MKSWKFYNFEFFCNNSIYLLRILEAEEHVKLKLGSEKQDFFIFKYPEYNIHITAVLRLSKRALSSVSFSNFQIRSFN